MTPRQYEEAVGEHYRNLGYNIELTALSGDYGIDIFATKKNEKLAIQVKMYGNTTRKINRQMIMELYGAKNYFNCTRAIIATNGLILPDAIEVARKLEIEVFNFNALLVEEKSNKKETVINEASFEKIWQQYIMPLEGKTLVRPNGDTNVIIKVDWSGVIRKSSNGNDSQIKIETFKFAIQSLLTNGSITRDEINQFDPKRVSSGVVLILSQVPFFCKTEKPMRLTHLK